MATMTFDEALALPIDLYDGTVGTIRDHLFSLLNTLWNEKEGFSGKRPLGNSGWEWDLYVPLIKAGIIRGEVDADGEIADIDEDAADGYVQSLIYHVFYGSRS